jgi:hypothetical protein
MSSLPPPHDFCYPSIQLTPTKKEAWHLLDLLKLFEIISYRYGFGLL